MEKFFTIILLSVVIEGIVTYAKTWVVDGTFKWQQILTVIFGILISVAYNIDLIAQFGAVSVMPYVGNVLTGILISRGSNYIFDIIKQVTEYFNKSSDGLVG